MRFLCPSLRGHSLAFTTSFPAQLPCSPFDRIPYCKTDQNRGCESRRHAKSLPADFDIRPRNPARKQTRDPANEDDKDDGEYQYDDADYDCKTSLNVRIMRRGLEKKNIVVYTNCCYRKHWQFSAV